MVHPSPLKLQGRQADKSDNEGMISATPSVGRSLLPLILPLLLYFFQRWAPLGKRTHLWPKLLVLLVHVPSLSVRGGAMPWGPAGGKYTPLLTRKGKRTRVLQENQVMKMPSTGAGTWHPVPNYPHPYCLGCQLSFPAYQSKNQLAVALSANYLASRRHQKP